MPHAPIKYPDGTAAPVGDIVRLNGELSTVETLIAGGDCAVWGVEESAVLLQNESFGRVFIGSSCFAEEDLLLVSREK